MTESSRIEDFPTIDIYSDGNILKKVVKPGSGQISKRDDVTVKLKITQGQSEIFNDDALTISLETQFVPQSLIDLICTMQLEEISVVTVKSDYFIKHFSEYVPDVITKEDLNVSIEVREVHSIENLYGDGSYYFRYVEKTDEIPCGSNTRARIHYKIEINGYNYLDNYGQVPLQVLVDDERLPSIWRLVINRLKQGETARLECNLANEKVKLLDNGKDVNLNISSIKPKDSDTAYLYIKIISFDTGLLTDKLTTTERSELSLKIKDDGNVFFKAGDYQKAIELYLSALATLEPVSDDPSLLRNNSATILSNLTLVHIKLLQWTTAEEYATKILEINTNDVKALYRRALSRIGNNKLDGAMEDLKTAKTIAKQKSDNETLALIQKEINAINAEFKHQSDLEKTRYKNLFK